MDAEQLIARSKELTALADEIQNSDRPIRVKLVRLNHIRKEMRAVMEQLGMTIEEIEEADPTNEQN